LNGQHRYLQDPEWGQILTRFRNGTVTTADIGKINNNVHDKNYKLPSDIKYATYTNKDRDLINTSIFLDKLHHSRNEYHHTNNFILIFCDNMMVRKPKNKDIYSKITRKRSFYENASESDIDGDSRNRIDPILKVYLGCELMLTENIDVAKGLANGTRAIVVNIMLKANETYQRVIIGNNISIKAVYASAVEYITLQHINTSIQPTTFTLKPQQNQFRILLSITATEPELLEMKTIQLPLISNTATTVHKLQGIGVDKLFVYSVCYQKNWLYVALSRVRQLKGLILARRIDSNLDKYVVAPALQVLIQKLLHLLPLDIDYSYFMHPNI
jgi:hypothetical protein